jgi:putative hemolysin
LIIDLFILLLLIVGNGLFAGTEIAVLTSRRGRIQELADAGHRGAAAVVALRKNPERFLATVQVGITVVSATGAVFGGEAIARPLGSALVTLGFGEYAGEVAFVLVVALVSYLSLVIGELVPKSIALRFADRYATVVGRPLAMLAVAMRPLIWFLTASSNVVLRLFGDRTSFTEARLSRDELRDLVQDAAKTGSIDSPSSEIASRAIGFGEVTVAELCVPRGLITALPRHASAEEVKRVLLEEGHSRMPVHDGALDQMVGYVVAKDILSLAWESPLVILEDILRPVYFVPPTAKASDVLRELQRRRTQLAIVLDEHGMVVGLVTTEDLVEELVGEIFSEHEPERVHRDADGSWVVDASMPIREVNRDLGLELPDGDEWTTLAGLVIGQAGAIPSVGTIVRAEGSATIEVIEATAQRVVRVRISRPPLAPDPSPDSSAP